MATSIIDMIPGVAEIPRLSQPSTKSRRAAAWGVHIYTALGLPLAFVGAIALANADARLFFLTNMAAVFVDSTDGTLARAVKVRSVLPQFDGRRLDDLVDFLIFAFLPSLSLVAFNMLPSGYEVVAVAPLLASGYGFCQEKAKTHDAFVGFPSYWNIVVLYLYVLEVSPWAATFVIVLLTLMVFIPIHYLYPAKTEFMRPLTIGFGSLWALLMIAIAMNLGASWAKPAALCSLVFPLYYLILSLVHHQRIHRFHEEPNPR
jgi:phosphatidylcholine synthase